MATHCTNLLILKSIESFIIMIITGGKKVKVIHPEFSVWYFFGAGPSCAKPLLAASGCYQSMCCFI